MASPKKAPQGQGKENAIVERKRKFERASVNRDHFYSLAELLPGKKSLFFLLHSANIKAQETAAFWSHSSI